MVLVQLREQEVVEEFSKENLRNGPEEPSQSLIFDLSIFRDRKCGQDLSALGGWPAST